MTPSQNKAVWELCRQGLPLVADEAAAKWSRGERYMLDQRISVAREVKKLVEMCNWEACLQTHDRSRSQLATTQFQAA
jgi:hypothetical protein